MAHYMKAAVVHAFGEPLSIEEVPVPSPGVGQILVNVKASGVCHTDLHAANGDWPVNPAFLSFQDMRVSDTSQRWAMV